jgi:hypothetical protein
MKPTRHLSLLACLFLAGSPAVQLLAAEPDATQSAPAATPVDPAGAQKRIADKATRLISALKIEDADKTARVQGMLVEWLVTLSDWHRVNDPALKDLWSQWNQARSVVPKDEFPAEVIAHRIDAVYASLKPAYQAFVVKLSAELTPEQINALKERWSRSPGMKRTYNGYLEIVPDLTEAQKKVIYDRMYLAREDAMLTDADKEIINIFKRHKVKVEAYVGTLEWAKLHSAFAKRAATKPAAAGSP